ncbi:hypothetical protein ABE527_10305 [Brucella sp. TWI432]
MNTSQVLKYITWSNGRWVMRWRHPISRFGNDRSRRIVEHFSHKPEKVDRIARLVIEAGSTLRSGKAVEHV